MASMFSKPKQFALLFIYLWFMFLFLITMINYIHLTINYTRHLHAQVQNLSINLTTLRKLEWFDVVTRKIKDDTIMMGLVNMDGVMDMIVDKIHPKTKLVKVNFDYVDENIIWSDLYRERIDEIKPSKCPHIPMPRFEDYRDLDVVVARASSDIECEVGGWRDIFRLQINLIVANLLVKSGKQNDRPVFVVFLGSCAPLWEIFRCEDILWNEGKYLVYKPDLKRIKKNVLMPWGSCQFAPPLSRLGEELHSREQNTLIRSDNRILRPKEAYVTILHSSEDYICGAIALAQSIVQSNSTKDLVLLVDDNISTRSLEGLRASGWKIKHIQRIRSPYSASGTYNEWNYIKLRIWQLYEYEKVMFIDSDLIVKRNMDAVFNYPQLTASGNYQKHLFNSGLMLVEPSKCTFKALMKKRFAVGSYNGGDQGFLNEMFVWWHRLPAKMNYLKVFVDPDDHVHQIPDDVYAIHYTGLKPWKCHKEYDCNWDDLEFNRYASNSAHKRWWHVYNTMPMNLRQFCSLNVSSS